MSTEMTQTRALQLLGNRANGVQAWNEWRRDNPRGKLPSLAECDLSQYTIDKINLCEIDLSGADLSRAYLNEADLSGAKLCGACLDGTRLNRANLSTADLTKASLKRVQLKDACCYGATLCRADLSLSRISGARFVSADLRSEDFTAAEINHMFGNSANFSGARLEGAKFTTKAQSSARRSFLDLASAEGLEEADFGAATFLPTYVEEAFFFAHKHAKHERKSYPIFFENVQRRIRAIRGLCVTEHPPVEIINATNELVARLKEHPAELYRIEPRRFEELVAELLR